MIALFQTLRPRQWTKNLIVYAALIFDQKLFDQASLIITTLGFIVMCFIAGTVYIINDLVDVEKDRQHPEKKKRPIASGALRIPVAIGSAITITVIALPASFLLKSSFGWLMALYLILHITYSFKLKNMVLIDAIAIAAGFTIRVGAGVVLVEVSRFSPWLFVCSTLLMLFMAFGKRRQEIMLLQAKAKTTRTILSHYTIELLDNIISVIASTTIMAYALYTFNVPHLPHSHAMMLTIPFVVYGIFRYLYVIHIEGKGGDPSEVFIQDRPLQITLVLWGISAVIIVYWQAIITYIFP